MHAPVNPQPATLAIIPAPLLQPIIQPLLQPILQPIIQPLPTTNPLCHDPKYKHLFDNIHHIEPLPAYEKPKMIHFKTGKRHSNNKHGNICHTPVREIIPNAVCPEVMPKHICEVFMKPRINKNNGNSYPRANRFLVSYNLI